ncbi:DUF6924 domain-containing protein, partial [Streptomyces sp. NPDC059466]|uniref:DUF6924 domain-containing protein n=1 Tax=Streptomyces sp. NPDC059466 TaxID=3346843 RepID=UPI0036943309
DRTRHPPAHQPLPLPPHLNPPPAPAWAGPGPPPPPGGPGQPRFARDGLRPRVTAAELWGIENNLSLANMDFEEFTGAAGNDGVFRGF